jgi:hypothetical protein
VTARGKLAARHAFTKSGARKLLDELSGPSLSNIDAEAREQSTLGIRGELVASAVGVSLFAEAIGL